mmetsp:Transcript_142/g.539  ORF Transcript_142/g.539 Transcript_142/m.539 type:complete len:313 (+) Transcript_142:560-1498(+)
MTHTARHTRVFSETQRMGHAGRYLATRRAERPVLLSTTMALALTSKALKTPAAQMLSSTGIGGTCDALMLLKMVSARREFCASTQILAMYSTTSFGYDPLAVSPDSMTQSAPSSTALATSLTSARVGRGLYVIDSSICVAQMTGLPTMLHLAMSFFCAMTTFSAGISTPRSPRATMMPSEASMMASMLATPWWFSILLMMSGTCTSSPAGRLSCSTWRTSRTCAALRMKEAKTKSHCCCAAMARSARSFSETAGRSTSTPGRLHPLRLVSVCPLRHTQTRVISSRTSVTSRSSTPSSMKTWLPTFMTRVMFL